MNVLLITNFYYPEKTGIGVTATDCAEFIQSYGHDVTVVTSMPYYPEWEVYPEYRGKFIQREKRNGVNIERLWLYVPKQPNTLKRIIHELSVSAMTFVSSLFKKTDLVLCIMPPLPLGFTSMILAKLRFKRFWCYIKDIQPDAAIDLGMLNNKIMVAFSFWMEKMTYRYSEKILVLSSGMKRNLERKGVPSEKIIIVPDSIDVDELQPASEETSIFRTKHNLTNKFLVLYSGNLGIKHNVEIIVDCAKELRDRDDIFFTIVGQGAAKESVLKKIEEHSLSNIRVLPLCPREELGDMLHSADVLLAPQRREVVDIVVPSKLLAYLTSKTPLIASVHAESEAARILSEHNAGKVVEPENVRALTDAILELRDNPSIAADLGKRGYEYVRNNFDHDVVKNRDYAALFNCSDS